MNRAETSAQIEAARGQIERRLEAKVVKAVALLRRKSNVVGLELARTGDGRQGAAAIVRVAVKFPRQDAVMASFEPAPGPPAQAVAREYAVLQAAHRLAAAQFPSDSAVVQVPRPMFVLEQPSALVMEFIAGHTLSDIMMGNYPAGLGLVSDRLAAKADGLARMMAGFGELAIEAPTRTAADEIAGGADIARWLADPERRREIKIEPAVIETRLARLAQDYRPPPAVLRHGDLKCGNLIVDQAGGFFLLDFADVSRGDALADLAFMLLSLKLDSSFCPPAVALADRLAAELASAWARYRPIDLPALALMLTLQAAWHAAYQIERILRRPPGSSEPGRQRVAGCVPWLTGDAEALKWLDRVVAARC